MLSIDISYVAWSAVHSEKTRLKNLMIMIRKFIIITSNKKKAFNNKWKSDVGLANTSLKSMETRVAHKS